MVIMCVTIPGAVGTSGLAIVVVLTVFILVTAAIMAVGGGLIGIAVIARVIGMLIVGDLIMVINPLSLVIGPVISDPGPISIAVRKTAIG